MVITSRPLRERLGEGLFIAIMIVDADEGAAEGEDLAKGGEDGRIYHSGGWNDKGGDDEEDAEDDEDHGDNDLNFEFHRL